MSSDHPQNHSENDALAKEISEQIARATGRVPKKHHPVRSAIFRGLGVVLPPLLTIVIFLWVGVTIRNYVIEPVFKTSRNAIVYVSADIIRQKDLTKRGIIKGHPGDDRVVLKNEKIYNRVDDRTYVPERVFTTVSNAMDMEAMPATGLDVYYKYVEEVYLQPYLFIPIMFVIFIVLVYLVGRFIAAGIGRFFWRTFEHGVERVPLVRNVYGAVKQVIDFFFAEKEMQFSRVVAVEWPRKGIWALALVTGVGMYDIEDHVGEEHYSVLVPTSPMPMTGFTLTIRKSEALELSISIDQGIQFIVSCGVVVPMRPTVKSEK